MVVDEEERQPLLGDKTSDDTEKQVRIKPKRLLIIEPYMVISMLAGFPLTQVYDMYFLRRVGYDMGIDYDNLTGPKNKSCSMDINDTSFLLREAVQGQAAQWKLYMTLAFFIPSLISMIIFGSFSDKHGRRICFLLPPISDMYIASVNLLIIHFDLPVQFFFFHILESIVGGRHLQYIGTYAYLADTTSRKWLGIRIALMDLVVMLCEGLASLGVGYFIKFQGYAIPCIYVICGKFITLLYAYFFIPETIPKRDNRDKNVVDSTEKLPRCQKIKEFIKAYFTSFYIFTKDNGTGRLWKIWLLCSSYFLYEIYSARGVYNLYLQNAPLCWGAVILGYYGMVTTLVRALGCSFVGFRRCLAEHWILVMSKSSSVLEYVVLLLARSTAVMFLGSLFAAMYCISSLCELVSTSIVNNVYKATLFWFDGFVFVVAIGIKLISLGLVLLYILMTRGDRKVLAVEQESDIKTGPSPESPVVQ